MGASLSRQDLKDLEEISYNMDRKKLILIYAIIIILFIYINKCFLASPNLEKVP